MILFVSFVIALALIAHDAHRQRKRGGTSVFGLLPTQWLVGPISILLIIGIAESALGTITLLTGSSNVVAPGLATSVFMALVPPAYLTGRRFTPSPEQMRERRKIAARSQEIAYDEAYWAAIAAAANSQTAAERRFSSGRTATNDAAPSPAVGADADALPAPRR